MPNWCYCELSVVGPLEERIGFKNFAEGDGRALDFNSFISYPKRFRIMDGTSRKLRESGALWSEIPKDGFNSGGSDWCIVNWGSKWSACQVDDVIEKPRSLVYKFDTAWSSPKPIVYVMAEMFPRLRFNLRFWESSMGFQGQLMVKGLVILKEWRGDYNGRRGG